MASFQTAPGVYIENLAEIERDLKKAGPLIAKAQNQGLLEGAQPIRREAEQLARDEISGMKRAKKKPPPWSIQRVGQSIHEVYIAPKERGIKGRDPRSRRPNFVGVMFGKSYNPALEHGLPMLTRSVENWLGKAIGKI